MADVGLAGLPLDYPYSGTALYTRSLARFLPQVAADLRFTLFLRNALTESDGVAVNRIQTPFAALNRGAGPGARLDKLAWEVVGLPMASGFQSDDLLHYPYFAAPIMARGGIVVTIHDLIPLVLPGYHRSRQSALYSRFMALTARRADAIITVSQYSAGDIVRLLRVPEERVYVTHEAVDERFYPDQDDEERHSIRLRYGLPERFLLYTGGAEKRKNIELLIRAWKRIVLPMRDREVKVVVVANFPKPDRLYPDVPGLVDGLGLRDDVLLVPHVAEEDKAGLYRTSLAFVFPSRYEGFGFTPLEAMACGIPVIASSATSIPEVVGDAGLLLSPDDAAAWSEAMLHLVDMPDQRAALGRSGVERAAQFSWRRTAERTAAIYRETLGR